MKKIAINLFCILIIAFSLCSNVKTFSLMVENVKSEHWTYQLETSSENSKDTQNENESFEYDWFHSIDSFQIVKNSFLSKSNLLFFVDDSKSLYFSTPPT